MRGFREVRHPAFGTVEEWRFRGDAPMCSSSTCVDYVMNDGGHGFAVLGGGDDAQTVRTVTRRMAMALAPR